MSKLLITALILSFSLSGTSAYAAVKQGSACKKLNSVAMVGVKKFTCIKQGNRLNWSNVSKVSVTKKSSFVAPKEVSSFQDAIERPQDVSYWAWKKSSNQILGSDSQGPSVELIIGPNTKLSYATPSVAIEAVTRLYSNFRKPNKIYAIYYSHRDIDWAQEKYSSIYTDASGQEAKSSCQTVESCWGASATINNSGDGVMLTAVMTSNPDRNHTTGTLEAHEYTHVLQIGNFYGTNNQSQAMCCIKAFTPWWFAEGGAEFSQIAAIYANSFSKYSEERRFLADELFKNKNSKFSELWVTNFIKPPDTQMWMNPENQWRLYDLGMLAAEIFTAIKGPSINLQIYRDIANGMTWETSFKQLFGVSWEEAAPLISKSIALLITK